MAVLAKHDTRHFDFDGVQPVGGRAGLPRQGPAQHQQIGDDIGARRTVRPRRQTERADQIDLTGEPFPPRPGTVGVKREP